MPNLSNRELDDLFREGAEMQEFSYNEAAWADVSTRLDQREKKRRLLLVFSIIFAISILATATYYLYTSNSTSLSKEHTTIAHTKSASETNLMILQEKTIGSNVGVIEDKNTQSNTVANTNDIGIQNNWIRDVEQENSDLTLAKFPSSNSSKSSPTNAQSGTGATNLSIPLHINELRQRSISSNNIDLYKMQFLDEIPATLLFNELDLKNFTADDSQDSKGAILPGFVFTTSVGAEWSSVEMEPLSDAGKKFEARIGYQFAKRFEVTTGLAYAKKMFKTSGSTFAAREEIWTDNVVPEVMYGEDQVIEIPLQFTYYTRGYNKNGLFGSAGLRSYMMHKELFNFEYTAAQTQPNLIKEYTMIDENNHWMSIARFSVGYQYRLGKNYALQVSPYVQIPLKGVGLGNQMLYSAGVQFSTRFNL